MGRTLCAIVLCVIFIVGSLGFMADNHLLENRIGRYSTSGVDVCNGTIIPVRDYEATVVFNIEGARESWLSEYVSLDACEFPILGLTQSGYSLLLGSPSSELVSLEEVLIASKVNFSTEKLADFSINSWSLLECDLNEECTHVYVKTNSDGNHYSLRYAIESGMMIKPYEFISIHIKTETRTTTMSTLHPDFETSCSETGVNIGNSRDDFLPQKVNDFNHFLLECGTQQGSSGKQVVSLSNLSRSNLSGITVVATDGGLHYDGERLLLHTRDFNHSNQNCRISFEEIRGTTRTLLGVYSLNADDRRDCVEGIRMRMKSSSDGNFVTIAGPDSDDGITVVNTNTGTHKLVSSRCSSYCGYTWSAQSNHLIYSEWPSGDVIRFNAETNQSSVLISDEDYREITSHHYNRYLSQSNLFTDHHLFAMSHDNEDDDWKMTLFEFNQDFSGYVVHSPSKWDNRSSGCGMGHFPPRASMNELSTNASMLSLTSSCFPPIFGENKILAVLHSGGKLAVTENSTDSDDCVLGYNYGRDRDRDGLDDGCDTDADGDGIPVWYDACEYSLPEHLTLWTDDDWDGCIDIFNGIRIDFDMDNDGVEDGVDRCLSEFRNWTKRSHFLSENGLKFEYEYDNDNDGCHDFIEDDDDDNDGFHDTFDDCPRDETGSIDIDGDGDCEFVDLDDDGDGYSDADESICGSNSTLATSLPNDIDSDYLCDDVDPDIDNDGVNNEQDLFPNDPNEWNDLDSDGIGNNSDDCIGTYGTSFLDRLGCLDQDDDGVSDLNDPYPYDASKGAELYNESETSVINQTSSSEEQNTPDANYSTHNNSLFNDGQNSNDSSSDGNIEPVDDAKVKGKAIRNGVTSLVSIAVVVVIFGLWKKVGRSENESLSNESTTPASHEVDNSRYTINTKLSEERGNYQEGWHDDEDTTLTSVQTPQFGQRGNLHESGYEVLEFPQDSGEWWWRDEPNQRWVKWD